MNEETISVFLVKRTKSNRGRNIRMRYLCPLSQRWVYKTTGTTDAKAAEEARVIWEHDLRAGRYAKAGRLPWSEFRERYLDAVADDADKSPRTLEKATGTFNVIGRILSPRTVSDITADRLNHLKTELVASGLKPTTAKTHLAYLRSALNTAVEWGVIESLPTFPKWKRKKGGAGRMKGRPITGEEFDRLFSAIPKVVPSHAVASWEFFLSGLWWSGLRTGDACELYWSGGRGHVLDFTGRRPCIRICGDLEKGKQNRLLPVAPEFVQLLETVPAAERRGRVFRPLPLRPGGETPHKKRLEILTGEIGKAAGVIVATNPRTGEATKFASAHDLRRSFGFRWARRVMPAVLRELMRHASIETTMKYYVGENADATSDLLWQAMQGAGTNQGDAKCAAKCAGQSVEV